MLERELVPRRELMRQISIIIRVMRGGWGSCIRGNCRRSMRVRRGARGLVGRTVAILVMIGVMVVMMRVYGRSTRIYWIRVSKRMQAQGRTFSNGKSNSNDKNKNEGKMSRKGIHRFLVMPML